MKSKKYTWQEIYEYWKWAAADFPELKWPESCRKIAISEPQFGSYYHFNWVERATETASIQRDIAMIASYCDVAYQWSKGTQYTAALLSTSETEEEFAMVLICAYMLEISRNTFPVNDTVRHAKQIEDVCRNSLAGKYSWHFKSREFFPRSYLPPMLFNEANALEVSTLIGLAAVNAALVLRYYIPVAYSREFSKQT